MFADTALALRIEGAEARLMRDYAGATPGAGAFVRDLGGGAAIFVRKGSPMNKIIGVGLEMAIDATELAAIEQVYREHDEPARVELATLALPEVGQGLSERGYRLLGFENVLGLRLGGPVRSISGIDVTLASDLSAWRHTLVEGFAAPDSTGVPVDNYTREVIETVVADTLAAPRCERYLALIDGTPVGAASMRVDGDIALFTGATTLGSWRRRGVQGALLATRLRDAAAAGAKLAVITTAVGTQSQANAMKNGFTLLYPRAVLALPPR